MIDSMEVHLGTVFHQLDKEQKGFITVDQFKEKILEYNNNISQQELFNLLNELDQENDGKIYFNDFVRAFNGMSAGDAIDLDPLLPAVNKSACFSEGTELKTDDSGVAVLESGGIDDNDSCLSVDMANGSHIHRDEVRRSWPKHRGGGYLGTGHPDSPVSVSRSDFLMDDMETNIDLIREQMQRMEDRQVAQMTEKESRIERLRDDNARLNAQVTVLEERLKEVDARAQRTLETEREHLQSLMKRMTRDHESQLEQSKSRISALEAECSELRLKSVQFKAESETGVVDSRRTRDALTEAEAQIADLKKQLSINEAKYTREMDILRKDRDHAVHVLEELSGRKNSRSDISSNHSMSAEMMARQNESQEIIRRLTTETKLLRKQLEEAQEELVAQTLAEGRSLVKSTERSWAAEIDNMTKEEVVELLTREKAKNEQLLHYIDTLMVRIIERQPSLLEIIPKQTY